MNRRKSNIELEIKKSYNTGTITLTKQSLVTIPELLSDLSHVRSLNLDDNKICYLDCDKLPPCIEQLFISNNSIKTLDLTNAPKTLKVVYANYNKIDKLVTGDCEVTCLFVHNNSLEQVDKLSDNILVLKCSKNKITNFKDLNKLEHLDCSNNRIKHFSGIHNLRVLDISNNPLESLTNLNKNMEMVVLKNTKLKTSTNIDSKLVFAKHCTGLPKDVETYLKSKYAVIIQSKVKSHILQKKYKFLKVIRDLEDLNNFKPNTNPKLLKVYFKKPNSKIARRFIL